MILIYGLPKLTTATGCGEIPIQSSKTDGCAFHLTDGICQRALRPSMDFQKIDAVSSMIGLLTKEHFVCYCRQIVKTLLKFLLVSLVQTVGLKSRQVDLAGFYRSLRDSWVCALSRSRLPHLLQLQTAVVHKLLLIGGKARVSSAAPVATTCMSSKGTCPPKELPDMTSGHDFPNG